MTKVKFVVDTLRMFGTGFFAIYLESGHFFSRTRCIFVVCMLDCILFVQFIVSLA